MTNFRTAKYAEDGLGIDDPNKLKDLTSTEIAALRELLEPTIPDEAIKATGQFSEMPYAPRARFQMNTQTNAWQEVVSGTAISRSGTPAYAAHPVWNTRKAAVLDGTNDKRITIPRALMGSMDGPVTILWVVKPNLTRAAATTETRWLMHWADPTTNKGVTCQLVYHFSGSAPYANTTTALVAVAQDFPVSSQVVMNGQSDIPNGTMAVIGWSYDGSPTTRTSKLYVNGVLESAQVTGYTAITPTSADCLIGIRNTGVGTTSFRGDFVEMIVIPRCLTALEMGAAYNSLLGTTVPRILMVDDGDTDIDGPNALAIAASYAYSGTADLCAVLLDGVGSKAAPAWRSFLNYLGFDFVPVYQDQRASSEVAYAAAPNNWPTEVVTAFRTPSSEDRTATANATSTINTANVNYPDVLAGITAVLGKVPNKSLTVVMSGFAAAMKTVLDDATALTAFTAKVDKVIIAAGWWYDAREDAGYAVVPGYDFNGTVSGLAEYNINRDQTNWKAVCATFPASVPVRFMPTELGYQGQVIPYAGRSILVNPMAKATAVSNGYLGVSPGAAASSVASPRFMWGDLGMMAAINPGEMFIDGTTSGRTIITTAVTKSAGVGGWCTVDPSQSTYDHNYYRLNEAKYTISQLEEWADNFTSRWMP